MCWPSASKSFDGCLVLAGLLKCTSSGQKIGHIMGYPPRLICRQPPASVASLVAHHTPVRAPGLSWGSWWETASTIDSTIVPVKLFFALSGRQAERSTEVPLLTASLTFERSDKSM